MKKILIIEDRLELREILVLILESEFENPIIAASGGTEAIEILKKDLNIGLIISDYHMPFGNGDDVFNYNQASLKIPFILLTGDEVTTSFESHYCLNNKFNKVFEKPWDEDKLLGHINFVLNQTHENIKTEFKRISTQSIRRFKAYEYKYYRKTNDFDYVPLKFSDGELAAFLKNTKDLNFYIQKDDFEVFINSSIESLEKSFESIKRLSEFFQVSDEIVALLSEATSYFKISEQRLETLNLLIISEFMELSKNDSLRDMVTKLKNNSGYLVGHSLLNIYISISLMRKMGFEEELIVSKLVKASLLHDVCLGSDELSSVFTKVEMNSVLAEIDKIKIREHSNEMANLLEKEGSFSKDVISMIKFHHENATGTGFPHNMIADELSTSNAVFNLSLVASDKFFKLGFSLQTIDNLISEIKSNYLLGNFEYPGTKLCELIRY